MTNKQKTINTLKSLKVTYNEKVKIMYSTQNLIPIDDLLKNGVINDAIYLIKEIINLIDRNLEEGFFVKEAFDISYDRIFYDKDKKQYFMVLLPVNSEFNLHDNMSWHDRFKNTILSILKYAKEQSKASDINQLFNYENANFERAKEVILNENVSYQKTTGSLAPSIDIGGKKNYYLLSDNNERCDIYKDNMIFGRSKKLADVVIKESDMISRIHFKIQIKQNTLYVSDLDSTNHTYYNGHMLVSGEEVALQDGGVIKAADVSFRVRCE